MQDDLPGSSDRPEPPSMKGLNRPRSVLERNDRLTIVLSVNHEHAGEDPLGIQIVYNELLTVQEQPYTRRIKIGSEWTPLEYGWIEPEKVGLVLLENLEGRGLQINPTEEERAEISKRIVEVSYGGEKGFDIAHELIPPRRFCLTFPSRADSILVRCQSGTANCKLTALSK